MPAYCTLDAREFGNKQDTFSPPPLKRKKERKKHPTSRNGGSWFLLTYDSLSGSGSSEEREDLITETCGSRVLAGQSAGMVRDFCDGTVCSHS